MAQGINLSARAIRDTVHADVLVTARIRLPCPAAAVLEIRKTVRVSGADPVHGGVLIHGAVCVVYIWVPSGGARGSFTAAHSAEIHFNALLSSAATTPDMICRVLTAHVAADHTVPAETDAQGRVLALRDGSLVQLCVRVLQEGAPLEPALPAPTTVAGCHVAGCHFSGSGSRAMPCGQRNRSGRRRS